MNGQPAQPALWQEAKTPEGRVYYYNTQTKATQWSKPADMLSPVERALAQSPWKEYSHDGRKYWHNAETNQTTWEMPEVYKNALARNPPPQQAAQIAPAAPTFVAGGGNQFQDSYRPRDRDRDDHHALERGNNDRTSGYTPMDGIRSSVISSQTDPDYSSFEEAESAFHKLLRRTGVQPDWTWEQTMRAVIKDPQYRAIKDPKDRRIAFEKYVAEVRAQEKDKEKERQAKLRADFNNMLRSHPEIKPYTRWKTARSIIERETVFRSARSDEERQSLFSEYRAELLKAHQEEESLTRKAALDRLVHLLQSLDLEPYTRWSEAQSALKADERFQGDEHFNSLSKIDVLKAFENHIKALERSFNDKRQKEKFLKARKERQNRDQFITLLRDLKSAGKIKAGTKWNDIHELIEDDPRYVSMLGQAGSTPLDLFWDVVEDEERVLRGKRNDVLDVLEDKRYELTQKTTFEEYVSVMQTDRRTATIDPDYLRLIFDRLRDKVLRRSDDDKHAQRRAIDSLRSKIKRLEPPVAVNETWEQVRPRIEKLEEYRALDSDDLRKQAFEKVIRRLKDRDDEHDRDYYHGRRDRDRERDRTRDADYRNGRGDSHRPRDRRTRTRTPEVDAYEADRKKAIADRERQYRKSSVTGLSPVPRRERDRDDRYDRERERDRYDARRRTSLSGNHDRDRRDREGEREKPYISRADPREKGSELDYGDSRPSSLRRRRDSEGEPRDTKRVRRDVTSREPTQSHSPRGHRRSRTPAQAVPSKEAEVEYKSGSEEGELLDD